MGNIIACRDWVPCPRGSLGQHPFLYSNRWDLRAVMYVHTITKLNPLLVSHELKGHLLETLFRSFCCDVCGSLLDFAKTILVASTMICGDAKSYLHFRTSNPCCLLQQWGDFGTLVPLVETEESAAASATWTIYVSSTIEATSIL